MQGQTGEVGGNLPELVEVGLRANDVYDQVGRAVLLEFCDDGSDDVR